MITPLMPSLIPVPVKPDRSIAHVPPRHAQDNEGGNSINYRGNGQRRAHSNQIGKPGDDEAGDRHQAKKAQAKYGGDATAKMRRRVLLNDRIGQAEVH